MSKASEISGQATWPLVARALGLSAVEDCAYPLITACPLCRGARLHVFEDTILGGHFHYCFDCHFRGSSITLAAAVWQISLTAALYKLAGLGIIFADEVNIAVIQETEQPERYADVAWRFWQMARKKPGWGVRSSDIMHLCRQLNLVSPLYNAAWLEGPGRIFGAVSCKDANGTFPLGYAQGGKVFHSRRFFPGPGQKDVICVPHFDIPGRICSFLFACRDGGPGDRLRYSAFQAPAAPIEGGLAGFDLLAHHRYLPGPTLVITGDPFLLAGLQMQHLISSPRPLPLLACCDDPLTPTRKAWLSLADKNLVHWGQRLTPGLLYRAFLAGGYLSVDALTRGGRAPASTRPDDIVAEVIAGARPWRQVLAEWISKSDDHQVEDLFLSLYSYDIDPMRLAATQSLTIQRRLRAILAVEKVQRVIPCRLLDGKGDAHILEIDNTWVLARGSQRHQISTFILKLAKVSSSGRVHGKVLTRHGAADFDQRAERFTGKNIKPLLLALARGNPSLGPIRVRAGWGKRILAIARSFLTLETGGDRPKP
jgi:hypothetical protein